MAFSDRHIGLWNYFIRAVRADAAAIFNFKNSLSKQALNKKLSI
jgi:hypothetical protein